MMCVLEKVSKFIFIYGSLDMPIFLTPNNKFEISRFLSTKKEKSEVLFFIRVPIEVKLCYISINNVIPDISISFLFRKY